MSDYKTPNVYVEEQSILPPSVAEVSTAIPAFIGYTEKAVKNGEDVTKKPVRITSLLEYQNIFGGAPLTPFTVMMNEENILSFDHSPTKYLLYYHLQMYFANGGGACYIVSVGNYTAQSTIDKEDLLEGLAALRTEDEPTLILTVDAINLESEADYGDYCQQALRQCADLKDRFAIFDVYGDQVTDYRAAIEDFRNILGTNNLKYGAAYFPNIKTTLNYVYNDASITVKKKGYISSANGLRFDYTGSSTTPVVTITVLTEPEATIAISASAGALSISVPEDTTANTLLTSWAGVATADRHGFQVEKVGTGLDTVAATAVGGQPIISNVNIATLKTTRTAIYNSIKANIDAIRVILPPSAAIAGIYASVDRERGVWKAPANVSLNSVIGPIIKLTNEDQQDLNVDANAGKSINVIRSFSGKGTLVWGARTLAGNDNEWRYISVRRLFNLIEESLQKATAFAVFEPNTPLTWLKLRTLIQSYLDDLWRQGALVGASAEEAFFVKVGLGQTMTEQDVLEGRLILEIGVAAARPAEFIVLRFAHKLQQA